MWIYDLTRGVESDALPKDAAASELFVLCAPRDVHDLREAFGFDESTVLDCTDLDESVRYTNYDGYDFLSLVHLELADEEILQREINAYISRQYLVLVMPEHQSPRLARLEQAMRRIAQAAGIRGERLNRLYYTLLHEVLGDVSELLEALEDGMEALFEALTQGVEKTHLAQVNRLHSLAYTSKKQLRALSYVGAQLLVDENNLIEKRQSRYFRSIDTRLRKLYDFAVSLYELSGELHDTYDSKLNIRMNDMVNKLTVLTLFFGACTVVTGIYGMNFEYMPELGWRWGYPLALLGMALIALVLYLVLKRKKWL